MNDSVLLVLTFCAALGGGLVAGAFFAFSTFIMKALGRLPPEQGIAAMQSINVTVINPAFMGALFGTGALYMLGTVGVTIVFNVPLNNALAAVGPDSGEGGKLWRHYLAKWTAWNHVRTAAALAAAAVLTIALCLSRDGGLV